ncbi:ATP-binding protein [Mycobacteroides abscessus]|uniref:ATP-binding protein n=1 Tax=Mycobacteroides abscessus TaxID=36809 RepID=UPI001F47DE32|nr:ATP-binding protein [Mycobacteroides abscessus]
MISAHEPEIGAHGYRREPPKWDTFEVDPDTLHFPTDIAFYSDTVVPGLHAVVVLRSTPSIRDGAASVAVHVRPADQSLGRQLLQQILTRADELNIFRGRVLQATLGHYGLEFHIIKGPNTARSKIIASGEVWNEIDLNVRAVSSQHSMMNALGLGGRRGVLLAGPPGVGKSAITSVIATEMAGDFTVAYCDASSGSSLLRNVFKECVRLGPSLVIIEDVDLIVGRRDSYGQRSLALSEFLAALDSYADAPLLIMATTNDVTTLDAAAVRAARFDSIVEVPYPPIAVARQIFSVLLEDVPGSADVDIQAVAASLPSRTSGADIREIVRRAVLQTHPISTATLQSQISSGRYRPTMPQHGNYL